MDESAETITYELDAQDRICATGGAWDRFALANGAPELSTANILQREIWSFVAGTEVRHLLRLLFERVRSRGTVLQLPFRCDAPALRRFMEMTLHPLPERALRIESRLVREEPRGYIPLLERSPRLLYGFLNVCSWCRKVRISQQEWVEVEQAVERLDLFAAADLPELTHGICPDCSVDVFGVIPSAEEAS